MQTIHKYPLLVAASQKVALPKNSEILTIQVQAGQLCLWAKVEIGEIREGLSAEAIDLRNIEIFGTGHPIPQGRRRYLATVQMDQYVWHVFEYEL